jgi:hypothetical protein
MNVCNCTMKIVSLLFFLVLLPCPSSILIQPVKVCANCKHFIGDTKKCSVYGELNIVTGTSQYEDAIDIRKDNKKCGKNAVLFEKNNFRFITTSRYFLIENWLNLLFLFLVSSYSYLLFVRFTF